MNNLLKTLRGKSKLKRLAITLILLSFAGSIFAIKSNLSNFILRFTRNTTPIRQTICINEDIQTIVTEEIQKTVETSSPKWASALIMDVKTGNVVAAYSSDSINRYRDTIEFGTLTMPLQLLDAIRDGKLNSNSKAIIHKEGITINGIHLKDSHPYDTILDIPSIIAASSKIGVATLLNQCQYDIHQDIFSGPTTMLSITDEYCKVAHDINQVEHDSTLTVIQQGLHKAVWDNGIGTASVFTWKRMIVRYKAQSDSVHIAGKTGVKQIYCNGVPQTKEHRLSFIGYFPEEAPKYCCLVVVDTPSNYPAYDAGYDCGGTVLRIAERILTN